MDRPQRRPLLPQPEQPSKPEARFNSLVAAAAVMARPGMIPGAYKRGLATVEQWQTELGRHFDSTGEFRFGVTWVANGLSRVNLVAARVPDQPGDEPVPISLDDDDLTAAEAAAFDFVNAIGGSPVGQSQLMSSFGQHLSLAGIGYLVVEPALDDLEATEFECWQVVSPGNLKRIKGRTTADPDRYEIQDMGTKFRPVHPNALIVQVWRKHPLRPWEPDCPARAALIVLEQIETLTLSITAVAQSRLAGNGILAIPSEATFPPAQLTATADPPDPDAAEPDPADLFIETLITATVTPIKDRGSAAAVVPLVVQIPGEHLSKMIHLTFEKTGVDQVIEKLTFAIRRLALALDMPPEVLLGVSDVNHWNMWQVAETAITLHIEPNAEAICDGFTSGFLVPALEASGLDPTGVMVWYDTSDLRSRPDKSGITLDLYNVMEASGEALRREAGLSEEDAPSTDERKVRLIMKALEIAGVQMAPVLLAALGVIPQELADKLLEASMNPQGGGFGGGAPQDAPPDAAPPEGDPPPGPPEQPAQGDSAPDAPAATAAALLEACDGLVDRALERAGSRLRSQAGRKVHGGASAIDCPDPRLLHVQLDATTYADLDFLLEDAWDRVPVIAGRLGIDAPVMTASLEAYTRALIAAKHPHTMDRLQSALGIFQP